MRSLLEFPVFRTRYNHSRLYKLQFTGQTDKAMFASLGYYIGSINQSVRLFTVGIAERRPAHGKRKYSINKDTINYYSVIPQRNTCKKLVQIA